MLHTTPAGSASCLHCHEGVSSLSAFFRRVRRCFLIESFSGENIISSTQRTQEPLWSSSQDTWPPRTVACGERDPPGCEREKACTRLQSCSRAVVER
eukprot:4589384-Prymnesium_polylepis.1